jgi:Skp family chaperone for outer membrane proteins
VKVLEPEVAVSLNQIMRINVFFLCLAGLTLPVFADEKLPLLKVGGQTYSNVTVITVTATDIFFVNGHQMGNAKLKDLDPALQQHFHYVPAKVQATEQKPKTGAALYQLQNITEADKASGKAAVKKELNTAVSRVEQIVNQPVTQLNRTPEMSVSTYSPGWFHPGAERPDFKTADVRATQDLNYAQNQYVTSDLNPGVVFLGQELEFNSKTKYFYTDRSLPKKKLSEAEMLEINRLYRVIARDEDELSQK